MAARVLIACEESQAVTKEMRLLGIEAYSCDIEDCSGGLEEFHIKGDVSKILNDGWDMILAFPPCTHLANSGAKHFAAKRRDGRQQAGIDFFMQFTELNCDRVAIENPIGIMSTIYRKPDQIIHPYQFGHGEKKSTCLWLKNLPLLIPTNIVEGRIPRIHMWPDSKGRSKMRSKTYPGIARAMAEQWGTLLKQEV